ncbi:uncharacterized protein ARMOST_10367 [Armillaria ostoyae]|uniref:Uncharacterized protein n=1 Tax=Armillaria ostoyae TaxID=47428 RepID=A0A284RE58_ARMOS|nr:uncharacterized protein ARMOST_10367 [Armillaria ostoyae]
MGDNNDVNVWGLRPRPRRKPSTFIDAKMQQTLEEHLDIYIKTIHNEDTDHFWMWFMDMWAKRFPQCFTASWEQGYVASYEACYRRLESRLDCMGGYNAKEEIDSFNRLAAMEAERENDSASSASEETTSGSSSMTTVPSDVVSADDGHDEQQTDANPTLQRRQAGLELRRKAVNRITAWCGVILATGTDPASEWERIDVDAWAEATGYDGKWLPE